MNAKLIQLFIDMEYLNEGLVPLSHYYNVEDNRSLLKILQAMTPDEQRKAKRKFRKILNKECKRLGILKVDNKTKRKNIVHAYIYNVARKKIDSLKSDDS